MTHIESHSRVLAIDPARNGFAYVVLEGPQMLVDWGVKDLRSDGTRRALEHVAYLMRRALPDVLVMEDCTVRESRRGARARRLISRATTLAKNQSVQCHQVSRTSVRTVFSRADATTKHQIATTLAELLPDLKGRLPPFRKPWMSEDSRMGIFDAASFAFTYYSTVEQHEQ